MSSNLTLGQSAESLHRALGDFIEASYHIGDERLVEDRRDLLRRQGVISQAPYVESTPRYRAGPRYEELGLPQAAADILVAASQVTRGDSPLVHDPPYEHQAEALRRTLVEHRSIVVTTGTGSGKTECFLFPILGRLAMEAERGPSRAQPAVRALLLYPMNALVNDQLGRLRLLLGDPAVSDWFSARWGRPARFARYTSRTLYPGVRTAQRDQTRLRPFRRYYVEKERNARSGSDTASADATLIAELKRRGKWPAKSDLVAWYGDDGSRWQDASGEFRRCVTMPGDPELLTRHEVLAAPPDLLVTNYSMLEYMLMRPLERPLFDATHDWLAQNPDEPFLVVVDEAHLYRGASGAEVGLLLRRLRDRLGIPAERLQVICTTASFGDPAKAPGFAASLSGKDARDFAPISGTLALRPGAGAGGQAEAEVLAAIDLETFYESDEDGRLREVEPLLRARGVAATDSRFGLFDALAAFPPMNLLVNETMQRAQPVGELASLLFPGCDAHTAQRASTALVALGSFARERGAPEGPGLLPSRLHAFFRGLAGLWICLDSDCTELEPARRGGVAGRLYDQPVERCGCGGRVLEYYTCRHCGASYCRAYTDDPEDPSFLWSSPGTGLTSVSGSSPEMAPIDLLLGAPLATTGLRPVEVDLVTGRIDPRAPGPRVRPAYLSDKTDEHGARIREFRPCAVCGKTAAYGRSSVQDHQTKGDEPFQALIARQVEIQPPSSPASEFAPLRGRKALVFSDSRQSAAKLAPNLQRYTTIDAVRPLLAFGMRELLSDPDVGDLVTLEEGYLAVLLASRELGVRLRPTTRVGETFESDLNRLRSFPGLGNSSANDKMRLLLDFRSRSAPETLVGALHAVVNNPYIGFGPLAIASLEPRDESVLDNLPGIPPDATTTEEKRGVLRAWLDAWPGQWLRTMPSVWADDEIRSASGRFPARMKAVLAARGAQAAFERLWLPVLSARLCEPVGREFRLRGADLTLRFGGDWGYCDACRSTQRPLAGRASLCTFCGRDQVRAVDPGADQVFLARKGYYRRSTLMALERHQAPIALVAAEHTAQLNEAQADAVFSEAEENELLFQDINLGEGKPAIDVLSCTTTMEVGIDIGALSGVALRNMPPSRANYQQRSGRAGRRGKAVATVTAFANTASHDEHVFGEPGEFIRGTVTDPEMNLDNWQIARRHLTAFVIQEYLRARMPASAGANAAYGSQLFEVLGTVAGFRDPASPLNLDDFRSWVGSDSGRLAARARAWLPGELGPLLEPQALEAEIRGTPDVIADAISAVADASPTAPGAEGAADAEEVQPEVGDATPGSAPEQETLLGRLLYMAVLPRYAFPTDVATFHVFDAQASTLYRPVFRYTPSQGMAVALTQYAPGKKIWIGGREWVSGAIYARMPGDRAAAWAGRKLYLECGVCHYATTADYQAERRRAVEDCPACGAASRLGPAQTWMRPPGFAHPHYVQENTSPDDDVAPSYATRAKLTAATPAAIDAWASVADRIATHFDRLELLVTNRGPSDDGYSYCTLCGLVEPAGTPRPTIVPGHRKPFPDPAEPVCRGDRTSGGIVLGTSFISDVLLVKVRVDDPLTLRPEYDSTRVALRTLAEALTIQAARSLSIGATELQAEFRPALTAAGRAGTEAEVYLYDTLPGGAGYTRRAGGIGRALFEGALRLLEGCPAGCDSSCYRCLRSFKNQYEHDQLDRHLGASLLRYLLSGETPTVDPRRVAMSTDVLYTDLTTLRADGLTLSRARTVDVAGFGQLDAPILAERDGRPPVVIGLHHPFAPTVMLDGQWTEPAEFGVDPVVARVDELLVRRNLPRATEQVLHDLGY
ncbi:MAG: DEAD/DEAH box helicase [Chloroflexota bacterium]